LIDESHHGRFPIKTLATVDPFFRNQPGLGDSDGSRIIKPIVRMRP
jgi:hypothetical protein